MKEIEKMKAGQPYTFADPEVAESGRHAGKLCAQLRTMTAHEPGYRGVIEELIPGIPPDSTVVPPFHCDHGHGIRIGRHCFINYDCVFLDGGGIRIGHHVLIGPGCHIYTPEHPKGHEQRRLPQETCHRVSIGDDTWLGGSVVVCPGVTIGKRCIIAAGSVVISDIPADCMAAGNPAVVKKHLNPEP